MAAGADEPRESSPPALASATGAARVRVLHEGDDLLVVAKPAGLVCHPTKGDAFSSLIGWLRWHRNGAAVHLVHRLDRETSGVCLAATSREAASELGRVFSSRGVQKRYFAIVHGHPSIDSFAIDAPLGKDEASPVAIQDGVRPDGLPAATRVSVAKRWFRQGRPFSLLEAEPLTGRKHQVRIHLAHAGFPIVGDKIYGGDSGRYLRFVEGRLLPEDRDALLLECQALHAGVVRFAWREKDWEFTAEPETEFQEFVASADPGSMSTVERPSAIHGQAG